MAAIPNFLRVGLDHFIGEDAGEIRLDGRLLPGVLQGLQIRGALKTDRAGSLFGGDTDQPLGFKAAVMFAQLTLPSDGGFLGPALGGSVSTCYDKLKELRRIFTEVDDDINAKPHAISNIHAEAFGIRQVWFSELDSTEADGDTITARLRLTQKSPPDFEQLRRDRTELEADLATAGIDLADEDLPQ